MKLVQSRFSVDRNIWAGSAKIGKHIIRQTGAAVQVTKNTNGDVLGHIPQQVQRLDINVVAWLRHAFF